MGNSMHFRRNILCNAIIFTVGQAVKTLKTQVKMVYWSLALGFANAHCTTHKSLKKIWR